MGAAISLQLGVRTAVQQQHLLLLLLQLLLLLLTLTALLASVFAAPSGSDCLSSNLLRCWAVCLAVHAAAAAAAAAAVAGLLRCSK